MACLEQVDRRIQTAESAMQAAVESAKEETKSSVGDKYETGRAMMQLELEKNRAQWLKALDERNELLGLQALPVSAIVKKGALVTTNQGSFFLATGIGKVRCEGRAYYAVSLASPIGAALDGKRAGDQFQFQGKTFVVESVE